MRHCSELWNTYQSALEAWRSKAYLTDGADQRDSPEDRVVTTHRNYTARIITLKPDAKDLSRLPACLCGQYRDGKRYEDGRKTPVERLV